MPRKTTKITTSELLLSAIFYLQQKNGVTAKEITKYICEKRGCAQKHIKDNVKKALERATVRGIFCRNRGLYRINNTFGLNKVLSKTKRRGPKGNKGDKPKDGSEEKLKFQICWEEKKEESQPMLFNEMVDKRMNDDYDTRSFCVVLPISCNQDEDDDEDFKDSEDDEDENDFFSDDNGNNNGLPDIGICHSFTDPFRKHPSTEQYPDFAISKEMLGERDGEGKITLGVRSEIYRERSEGSSDYSSEVGQFNGRNQFEDEYWDADQHLEEMDWDCQPNDLESIERLLERDNHPKNRTQRKHVVSDITRENRKRTKIQNNARITGFIENLTTDSFEASHMNESTR